VECVDGRGPNGTTPSYCINPSESMMIRLSASRPSLDRIDDDLQHRHTPPRGRDTQELTTICPRPREAGDDLLPPATCSLSG
jgi:hypothetical protein